MPLDAPRDGTADSLPAWPREWNGRRLYDTPHAYVYASGDEAASEARGIVESALPRLPRDPDPSSKGLILMTDANDAPLLSDEPSLLALMNRSRIEQWSSERTRAAGGGPPGLRSGRGRSKVGASAASAPATEPWDAQRSKMAAQGLPIALMFKSMSFDIAAAELVPPSPAGGALLRIETAASRPVVVSGGLPAGGAAPGGVRWAAAIPTRRTCRRMMSETMAAALRQKDVTFGQRLLITPWLPLIESAATDELAAMRDIAVGLAMIGGRADWSEQEKKQQSDLLRARADREQDARLSRKRTEIETRGGVASRPAGRAPGGGATERQGGAVDKERSEIRGHEE